MPVFSHNFDVSPLPLVSLLPAERERKSGQHSTAAIPFSAFLLAVCISSRCSKPAQWPLQHGLASFSLVTALLRPWMYKRSGPRPSTPSTEETCLYVRAVHVSNHGSPADHPSPNRETTERTRNTRKLNRI